MENLELAIAPAVDGLLGLGGKRVTFFYHNLVNSAAAVSLRKLC